MSRRFFQPSKIPACLKCSICSDVFIDPVLPLCGHTFCRQCIEAWIRVNLNCPICRMKIDKKKLTVNRIARLAVEDLEVVCLNKGCIWTEKFRDLEAHQEECLFDSNKIEPWVANKIPENKYGEDEDLDDEITGSVLSLMYLNYGDVIKEVLRPKSEILPVLGLFSSDEEN